MARATPNSKDQIAYPELGGGAVPRPEPEERLLRDAYDSVYQTLYGIFLVVHAAESCLAINPERLPEMLGFIRSQSKVGLDELRVLRDGP